MATDSRRTPGAPRRDLAVAEVSVAAGLATAAFAVAGVVGATGAVDLVLGGAPRFWLATAAWANALVVAVLGTWHHRRGFAPRAAAHAAGVCAVACALSSAVHLALSRDPVIATYLVATVVAAGAVLPMARWLVAVDAVALAGYAPLLLSGYASYQWQQFGVALVVAAATAHILQMLRARGTAQLQMLTEALARQARHDQLTGLLNRRGLTEAVGPLLAGTAGAALGVACLDVDGFKRINDELGHAAGDAVLVEIAETLTELCRHGSAVARLGGDEFALLVPGADGDAMDLVAHGLRARLTGTAGVLALPWAVSVGTAHGPAGEPKEVERLLGRADLSMYGDKQARRAARQEAAARAMEPAPSVPSGVAGRPQDARTV